MNPLKFENIGKCYTIKNRESFWALRNFSLEVETGEIVGIIGANGAGKSTLLKIVSRITLPTEGNITIQGRCGSLLEVGTGFHPEFTGMENIYFNGSVIGIPRKEIDAKLDDIIKFSGVEKFIDTPVKRYSSGMYTRLAFAIAAHLDVENMFVDEVLAVGDADFQRKCLSKMSNMANSGRTIIFVSHDMNAISRLCNRVVWLQDGKIMKTGEPNEVVQTYITHTVPQGNVENVDRLLAALPSDPTIKLTNIEILQDGSSGGVFFRDYPIKIKIKYQVLQKEPGLRMFIKILDEHGNLVLRTYSDNDNIQTLERGCYCSLIEIPANLLAHRNYVVSIGALIFNVRGCTGQAGEGIRIPVVVETVSPIDSYPEEAYQYRPMIEPTIIWNTVMI